ncbi:MAG: YlxR family protein [Bacillota bacterium]|nr:YlxR family protein [Bacillota bacterium]
MAQKRKIPQRMCLGCRTNKEKKELIRVVRTPEGAIELDVTGKKPGRGAYICPSVDCLRKAVKGKGLEKSLRRSLPEGIMDMLKDKLEE